MSPSASSLSFLRVDGRNIVDGNGNVVILKGCATGGHLNMENFITGYTGHEHELRGAMLKALGKEKYNYFFDKVSLCFSEDRFGDQVANVGI